MSDQTAQATPHTYPCQGCGAHVEFAPGTTALQCPYCGHSQQIEAGGKVREHSFDKLAAKPRRSADQIPAFRYVCQQCGAHTESDAMAQRCQFCAAALVVDPDACELIAPEAVMPFTVDNKEARKALGVWAKSRWFAPNRLKHVTEAETSKSTYLPHWTYDAKTKSAYTGQRGEYYYVTVTDSKGNTRRDRRTRWHAASGAVRRNFDDVLVVATQRLDPARLEKLEPWPLKEAVRFQPEFVAGHNTLRYEVEPEAGLAVAKQKMAPKIENDCKRDIGGDTQRVNSVDTKYRDVKYKLMLLPIWVCTYLYGGKAWNVLINGRTGEVVGERPYSWIKIAGAVALALAVVAALIFVYLAARGGSGG
ncbi:MAG: hypothetical protein ACRDXX_11605 [Stackebrandtia sp.]